MTDDGKVGVGRLERFRSVAKKRIVDGSRWRGRHRVELDFERRLIY